MSESIYKRKNYLINKKFQLKYTVSIVAMLLVVMLATGFGLYMGIWGSIIWGCTPFPGSRKKVTRPARFRVSGAGNSTLTQPFSKQIRADSCQSMEVW